MKVLTYRSDRHQGEPAPSRRGAGAAAFAVRTFRATPTTLTT